MAQCPCYAMSLACPASYQHVPSSHDQPLSCFYLLSVANLIPVNKIKDGKYEKSSVEKMMAFRDLLNDKGIVATIRRELGSDISAACGQLVRDEKSRPN